jgi:excisionase family DNA binding protein
MLAARLLSEPEHPESSSQSLELVDAPAMAALFNVHESWIRGEARAGRIPSLRLGRYVRFRATEVQAALAKRQRG